MWIYLFFYLCLHLLLKTDKIKIKRVRGIVAKYAREIYTYGSRKIQNIVTSQKEEIG